MWREAVSNQTGTGSTSQALAELGGAGQKVLLVLFTQTWIFLVVVVT